MKRTTRRKEDPSLNWLPVDSRLFTPFLSFGHVRGIAKVFLSLEIALAFSVVFGAILLVLLRVMP